MKLSLVDPFHLNHLLAGPSAAGNSDVSPRYAERLAHDTADRFVRLPKLRGRPYPHLKRPIVPPGNSIFTRTGRYSNGNAAHLASTSCMGLS